MTYPNHTAYELSPIPIPSYAEQIAAKKARDRKWGISQASSRRVNVAQSRKAPVVATVKHHVPKLVPPPASVPLWQREEIWFDAHEEFFDSWRINRPLAYVMAQAKAAGSSIEIMQGASRTRPIVKIRHRLMFEVWKRFGLTLPQVGRIFGGRDNSTVTKALRKHGVKSVVISPLADRGNEIYAMWRTGLKQQAIADRLGYTQSSVCRYMRGQPWWPKPQKRVYVKDHAARIREMYEDGASFRAIADDIGFKPDAVSAFIKAEGWKR